MRDGPSADYTVARVADQWATATVPIGRGRYYTAKAKTERRTRRELLRQLRELIGAGD